MFSKLLYWVLKVQYAAVIDDYISTNGHLKKIVTSKSEVFDLSQPHKCP